MMFPLHERHFRFLNTMPAERAVTSCQETQQSQFQGDPCTANRVRPLKADGQYLGDRFLEFSAPLYSPHDGKVHTTGNGEMHREETSMFQCSMD